MIIARLPWRTKGLAGASEAPAGIDPPGLPGLIHPAAFQFRGALESARRGGF
jgi:hypothetical protein